MKWDSKLNHARLDAKCDFVYKLTNIVKWTEIDKMYEMNTATLQN